MSPCAEHLLQTPQRCLFPEVLSSGRRRERFPISLRLRQVGPSPSHTPCYPVLECLFQIWGCSWDPWGALLPENRAWGVDCSSWLVQYYFQGSWNWVIGIVQTCWLGEILIRVGLRTRSRVWGTLCPPLTLSWAVYISHVPMTVPQGVPYTPRVQHSRAVGVSVGILYPMVHPPPFHCHPLLLQALCDESESPLRGLACLLKGFLEACCSAMLMGLSDPFVSQVGLKLFRG